MALEDYVCSLLLSRCGHGSSCYGKRSDDDEVLSSLEERAYDSSEEDSITLTKVGVCLATDRLKNPHRNNKAGDTGGEEK